MLTYHVCPQLSNHRNPTKTANIFPPQAIAVAFAALEFSSTGPHDYLLHPFRPLLQRHLLMRHLLTMPVGCNGDIPFWILTFLFLFLKSYYFGYGCTPGIWKLPKLILTLLFFFSNLIIIFFFFGHGCTWGMWKFTGYLLNPSYPCKLQQSFGKDRSLTHCVGPGDWTYASVVTRASIVRFLTS